TFRPLRGSILLCRQGCEEGPVDGVAPRCGRERGRHRAVGLREPPARPGHVLAELEPTVAGEVREPIGSRRESHGSRNVRRVPAGRGRDLGGLSFLRTGTTAGTSGVVDTQAQLPRRRLDVEREALQGRGLRERSLLGYEQVPVAAVEIREDGLFPDGERAAGWRWRWRWRWRRGRWRWGWRRARGRQGCEEGPVDRAAPRCGRERSRHRAVGPREPPA